MPFFNSVASLDILPHPIFLYMLLRKQNDISLYCSALSVVGLILIAFGTGGIKPCVAAFGGDQFEDDQVTICMKLSATRVYHN